jgi:alpha-galactosidase
MFQQFARVALFLAFLPITALSQTATFDASSKVFRLDSPSITYAFGINERSELQPLYWGSSLALTDKFPPTHSIHELTAHESTESESPQEFGGWGQGLDYEPALKITFPDGNRDLVLHYVSHSITDSGVDVVLKDIDRDVRVTLHYSIDSASGILSRSATITNHTPQKLNIEQAAAATWNLPRGTGYNLRYLTGRWSGEWQLQARAITTGATVLESRAGATSHKENPWFAVSNSPSTNEQSGDVWFGELGWSGSWRIAIEQDSMQQVRITGGYNPFDFGYVLNPGGSLETPVFYAGHTTAGYGEASRLLHRFQLANILPGHPTPKLRPVLYNSWEATTFDVTEAGQIALAKKAASLGVERFVMDDGWFGQRKDDHAGLGDWYVNTQKFPHGLKPLIDRVHALNMDFGIWVEPEMVNKDSDLYRAHPDWILHFNGRPQTEGRNQLVLNLALPEVRTYIFHVLDDLVTNNDIAFLKWDYNRPWSEPGWPQAATEDQKKVYVAFVDNLYSILRELRAKHPKLEIESCSSGGGRVDLGILRYTEEVWTSDNTDAFDRLTIQDGFTQAYTPGIMMAWVTDVPSDGKHRAESLEYRFLASMQGGLGIGANLNRWTPEDFTLAKKMVGEYKSVRETVQHGDLYRLVSPANGSSYSSSMTVSRDRKQAVLFAYLHASQFRYPYPRLFLQGLDPNAEYTIKVISGATIAGTPTTASGSFWMHRGIDINLSGDYQGAAFVFTSK